VREHARVTEEHARELAETQATLQTIAELARQVSSTADPRGLVCETAVRTSGASVATLIEPDGRGGFQILDETGVESIVFEPIVRNDKPVGVLGLGWTEARSELDDRTANVVTYLAAEAGAAIERADLIAQLAVLANTDSLTGLSYGQPGIASTILPSCSAASRRSWADRMSESGSTVSTCTRARPERTRS